MISQSYVNAFPMSHSKTVYSTVPHDQVLSLGHTQRFSLYLDCELQMGSLREKLSHLVETS